MQPPCLHCTVGLCTSTRYVVTLSHPLTLDDFMTTPSHDPLPVEYMVKFAKMSLSYEPPLACQSRAPPLVNMGSLSNTCCLSYDALSSICQGSSFASFLLSLILYILDLNSKRRGRWWGQGKERQTALKDGTLNFAAEAGEFSSVCQRRSSVPMKRSEQEVSQTNLSNDHTIWDQWEMRETLCELEKLDVSIVGGSKW